MWNTVQSGIMNYGERVDQLNERVENLKARFETIRDSEREWRKDLNQQARGQRPGSAGSNGQRLQVQRGDVQRSDSPDSYVQRADPAGSSVQRLQVQRGDVQRSDSPDSYVQRADPAGSSVQRLQVQRGDVQRSDSPDSYVQRADPAGSSVQRLQVQQSDSPDSYVQQPQTLSRNGHESSAHGKNAVVAALRDLRYTSGNQELAKREQNGSRRVRFK
jgi:hypothetical protein